MLYHYRQLYSFGENVDRLEFQLSGTNVFNRKDPDWVGFFVCGFIYLAHPTPPPPSLGSEPNLDSPESLVFPIGIFKTPNSFKAFLLSGA